MTLEQLRIFIAVAEKQHVTQAAGELNLTQSAASAAIAALEARYDIKLFDRVGRGIVLTQTGRDFLVEARAVLARARGRRAGSQRSLRIEARLARDCRQQTVANYWLPGRLQSFHAAYPGVDLNVTIANTELVARAVAQGSADLGFVEGEVEDASLSAKKIDGDALIVVVGARHPWVERKKITAKDLRRRPGCCASPAPARARCSSQRFGNPASNCPIFGSRWSCPPTRRSVPR